MKVPGTVTINLDDYLELIEHTHKTNDLKKIRPEQLKKCLCSCHSCVQEKIYLNI